MTYNIGRVYAFSRRRLTAVRRFILFSQPKCWARVFAKENIRETATRYLTVQCKVFVENLKQTFGGGGSEQLE